MKKIIYGIIALLSISAGAVGFHLIKQTKQLPPAEYALHYQQARPIAAFTLTDELGQSFNNSQLLDKWSLVFFGYTSCPAWKGRRSDGHEWRAQGFRSSRRVAGSRGSPWG